jgi:enoyl-CoA hydratase/carnithine racemase
MPSLETLTVETRDHVCHIGLNRPRKRNAFSLAMLRELSEAFTAYDADEGARCAVLFAHGDHFTGGLDLAEVGPAVRDGEPLFAPDQVDPLGLHGRVRTKPVVMAVEGWCLTIGIELALAMDIRVASTTARFGQIEINRGIMPYGGATLRLPQVAGWGNAMRWLLTGDIFDAEEAHRIGLVQDVVAPGQARARAVEIAATIARRAPLGVQATLRSCRAGVEGGFESANAALMAEARALMVTEDAAEGVRSFVERREAVFKGR